MPKLYDQADGRLLGDISQQDLDLLMEKLEATSNSDHDRDYCVDNDTFLLLVEAGASSVLLDAIKMALDLNGQADIRWEAD